MTILEGFVYGIFGGAISEVVGLYKIRTLANLPKTFKSKSYWLITALMIVCGGGLVCVYLKSDIALTPILALNVGISAPLVISRVAEDTLPSSPSNRVN